jgi:hypothetical protein
MMTLVSGRKPVLAFRRTVSDMWSEADLLLGHLITQTRQFNSIQCSYELVDDCCLNDRSMWRLRMMGCLQTSTEAFQSHGKCNLHEML